jgi:hypothetical protein
MTGRNHPASSVEFLSRLHDGEVPADEKIAFEEHRRSCPDCRAAADAFEASLAAFRASDVVPTPADLSARILRKIRSQSPSRRPFGVMFGIDVRWAGLLVAGLLAVLLSAPLVLRKPSAAVASRPPISATLVEAPEEPKTSRRKAAPPAAAENRPAAPAPVPPARAGNEAPAQTTASLEKSAALEAPAEDEQRRFAPAPAAAPETRHAPAASRSRAASEPVGGEAGSALEDVAAAARPPFKLLVTPLDGEGDAPEIVDGPDASRFASLRGREYVLTVEASGRVHSIEPSIANGFVAAPNAKTRPSATVLDVAAPLRELRFAPGDRPRRLAVRVP